MIFLQTEPPDETAACIWWSFLLENHSTAALTHAVLEQINGFKSISLALYFCLISNGKLLIDILTLSQRPQINNILIEIII